MSRRPLRDIEALTTKILITSEYFIDLAEQQAQLDLAIQDATDTDDPFNIEGYRELIDEHSMVTLNLQAVREQIEQLRAQRADIVRAHPNLLPRLTAGIDYADDYPIQAERLANTDLSYIDLEELAE